MCTIQDDGIEFFTQEWELILEELIHIAKERLYLVAPFITLQPLLRIRRQLDRLPKNLQPSITLITNLEEQNLLNKSLDIKALVDFAEKLQSVEVLNLNSLHAKIYLADQRMAIVTSANLTRGGLNENTEYGVVIRNISLVNQIHQDVVQLSAVSEKITLEELNNLCHKILNHPDYLEDRERSEETDITPPINSFQQLLDERQYFKAADDKDWLNVYRQEASQVPLLTAEEEVDLAKRMEGGLAANECLKTYGDYLSLDYICHLQDEIQDGEEAKEHLIWANTRLVINIAKRYKNRGLPFLDLIQEGNFGLMQATEKFQYQLGNRFSTYATWWIRQAVSRAVANQGRTIRLPVHIGDKLNWMRKIQDQLTQEKGREPTIEEIAEELDSDPNKRFIMDDKAEQETENIGNTLNFIRYTMSLDEQIDYNYYENYLDIEELNKELDELIFIDDFFTKDETFVEYSEGLKLKLPISEAKKLGFCLSELSSELVFDEDNFILDLHDVIEDHLNYSQQSIIINRQFLEEVNTVLQSLPEREEEIMRMRFGINIDSQVFTLQEVADLYNFSRQRAQQLDRQALKRIKNSSSISILREYFDR